MSTVAVYLFRHGETDWNHIGRMQGSADIPLNSRGVLQAEALREFFDHTQFDGSRATNEALIQSVRSSQLSRARETVRIALRLSELEGQSIITDNRWAETNLGQAEGMTRDELTAAFGAEAWMKWISLGEDSWNAKFPGSETKGEVRDRALAALNDLARQGRPQWFVATHGGLLRRLLHHFHPEETVPIDVVNGSVFKFVFQDEIWSVDKTPVFTPA